jgi:2-polyprenyl-6-methoxyphenol hydroxylase-like FAD-dependent oxidoreductase
MISDGYASSHGVIIGAGIAGLLAAHTLAEHIDQVILIERGSVRNPSKQGVPRARPGIAQARCLHLLMAPGARCLDQLLHGWRQDLEAMGAFPFDARRDVLLYPFTCNENPFASGEVLYGCSRGLLESMLRKRAISSGRITVLNGYEVKDLLYDGQERQVRGVVIHGAQPNGMEQIPAQLVVDAGGASSFLPKWLAARCIGNTAVRESVVEGSLCYISRWYTFPGSSQPSWSCLSIAPSAQSAGRAAMLLRVENGYWGLVLLAPTNQSLPNDDESVLAFTECLADGLLTTMLKQAKPASAIHHFGAFPTRWRHYEEWSPWPGGLIALGDSVCALDPYFGLGMSLACASVLTLRASLQNQQGLDWEGAFQRRLATRLGSIWGRTVGQPKCRGLPRGKQLSITAFANWAMDGFCKTHLPDEQDRTPALPFPTTGHPNFLMI